MPDTLTIEQARRLALTAQGFTRVAQRGWPVVALPDGRRAAPDASGAGRELSANHAGESSGGGGGQQPSGSRAGGGLSGSGGEGPSADGVGPGTSGALAPAATLRAVLRRLGAIQIDSINVVARSHELVLASRAGPHDPATFERLVYQRRAGFEYWGHAASFLPIEMFRLFLPRMARMAAHTRGWWADTRSRHHRLYGQVLERIRAEGPLAASDFREPGGGRRGTWWDWAPAKHVLEDLFDQGVVLVHDRVRFERRYDLAERVLPAGLDLSRPSAQEAAVELTVLAARALGVATAADLADYFRLRPNEAKPALAEAVSSGLLQEVSVQGWPKPAYLVPGTPLPRRVVHPPTLLSPFDSLIWSRQRTERLFDFHYRIEVYVPAGQRRHGYYTMPVLAGGQPVARVDPKHDRQAGALLLQNVVLEDGVDRDEAAIATAAAAQRLALHLGAGRVQVGPKVPRQLSAALGSALAATGLEGHETVAGGRPTAAGRRPAAQPAVEEPAAARRPRRRGATGIVE